MRLGQEAQQQNGPHTAEEATEKDLCVDTVAWRMN